ncbi:hypothetical protein MMC13_001966 [Lambiella insularis]|nr:hypothetical protein [Lambiella insularis]
MSAFAAAESFLAPVLQRESIVKLRGKSVVEIIASSSALDSKSYQSLRSAVVGKAATLLIDIHSSLITSQNAQLTHDILYTSSNRRVIDGLLDLISLEGIYPNLFSGVGVPIERRVKSVLQGRTAVNITGNGNGHDTDQDLLLLIVTQLNSIVMSGGKGLYNALQDRTLVDLIAARSQMAFSPAQNNFSSSHAKALQALLDVIPLSILFPILTSLLHPASPFWLRNPISTNLSLLPLRPNGVGNTIEFIASAVPQNSAQTEQRSAMVLSLDTLNHASRVLSSVPSTMTADSYFAALAPQLLALLDEEDTDLKRAASYIIGNGILGRRIYGAPGHAGWRAFVQPIFDTLSPKLLTTSAPESPQSDITCEVVKTNVNIQQAVSRLAAIILLHPNPGLVKRLMVPLLLPIWSIISNTKASKSEKSVYIKVLSLLYTYLKVSGGVTGLTILSDNLLWDGGQQWKFVLNKSDHIEIHRCSTESFQEIDAASLMETISARVELFINVVSDTASGTDIGLVFLHVLKKWLFGLESKQTPYGIGFHGDEHSFQRLEYAKLTQEMLRRYKDDIAAKPQNLLKVVQQVLDGFIAGSTGSERSQNGLQQPSIASLGYIVGPNSGPDPRTEEEEEALELVSTSLNLLNALFSSSDMEPAPSTVAALRALHGSISNVLSRSSLPRSLLSSASIASSLISAIISSPTPVGASAQTTSPHATALATQATALQNLASPLPPIRAEGLSSLSALIASSSTVLDIPSTTILLLSLLQDDDEYIYLAAIKALEVLSDKHSKTVLRTLMERYIDREEEGGLDVRLRIGEALRAITTALGTSLTAQSATLLGEGLISVAGRRGRRPKAAETRRKGKLTQENQKKEAEKDWDGPVPQNSDDDDEDEVATRIADVLSGWEGQDGEEDVRIRTSALSILGVSIEGNIAAFSSALVSASIDLCIAVLKIETTEEKAILRRSAALLLMSLVRALDKADDQGHRLGFGFAEEGLLEVSEVLGYLRDMERDEIVKGHEREVIEGLANWRAKKLIGTNSIVGRGIELGMNARLRGLDAGLDSGGRARPRIEEIE